ncbi:MAG: hypothetical protein V4700_01705 [Pseudomonadota bacterium]
MNTYAEKYKFAIKSLLDLFISRNESKVELDSKAIAYLKDEIDLESSWFRFFLKKNERMVSAITYITPTLLKSVVPSLAGYYSSYAVDPIFDTIKFSVSLVRSLLEAVELLGVSLSSDIASLDDYHETLDADHLKIKVATGVIVAALAWRTLYRSFELDKAIANLFANAVRAFRWFFSIPGPLNKFANDPLKSSRAIIIVASLVCDSKKIGKDTLRKALCATANTENKASVDFYKKRLNNLIVDTLENTIKKNKQMFPNIVNSVEDGDIQYPSEFRRIAEEELYFISLIVPFLLSEYPEKHADEMIEEFKKKYLDNASSLDLKGKAAFFNKNLGSEEIENLSEGVPLRLVVTNNS